MSWQALPPQEILFKYLPKLKELYDSGRVTEYMEIILRIYRDYPLTDWELERNKRIYIFIVSRFNKEFEYRELLYYVYRERLLYDERKILSPFIENFSKYLLSELVYLDYLTHRKYTFNKIVKECYFVNLIPPLDMINLITLRRRMEFIVNC